jgi:hypothetical protein
MIEILNRAENKKLGRAVVYFSDNTVALFEHGEKIRVAPRAEGHDWIHGREVPKREEEPEEIDVDKMIEVIGEALKKEAASYMEWALSSEDALTGMYQAARHGRRLTQVYW